MKKTNLEERVKEEIIKRVDVLAKQVAQGNDISVKLKGNGEPAFYIVSPKKI